MPKATKYSSEEQSSGAPEWMVTFSDCMTLLLTFFVLMLSFASFEDSTFPGIGASLAEALPSVGQISSQQKESMRQRQETDIQESASEGTETRTPVEKNSSNFMSEKRPLDFRNLKVFTVPSDEVFWGKRSALSTDGRELLEIFAVFLRYQPSRVVVSEIAPDAKDDSSMQRSWAVVEYLSSTGGISKELFSISKSTNASEYEDGERMLEITVLERSIY